MKHLSLYFCFLAILLLAGCTTVPRISVLGDSYSTFRGCIPAENAVYYPRPKEKNDVSAAEECWWYLVTAKLGGKLEKNESWSGSTVCNTGYNGAKVTKTSFIARTGRLGDPTLILVCGATNDSWANSPIGEYKWQGWTEEELFSFRPAMAKMLADLKAQYPRAKVYFILNTGLKAVINDSVHEICKHYKVTCIDLKDIDKQSGHPSVKGMKDFADQVVAGIRK